MTRLSRAWKIVLVVTLGLLALAAVLIWNQRSQDAQHTAYYAGKIKDSCDALYRIGGEPHEIASSESDAATVNLLRSHFLESESDIDPLMKSVFTLRDMYQSHDMSTPWTQTELATIDAATDTFAEHANNIHLKYCSSAGEQN